MNCPNCGYKLSYWEEANVAHCPNCGYSSESESGALSIRRHIEDVTRRPHHPECQCTLCTYGADAYLWLYAPSEY